MVAPPVTTSGLVRQLGVFSATAIVISNMVGTGIFTTTGFLAAQLGTPELVLLIWVVGALFALIGSFCYSELGVAEGPDEREQSSDNPDEQDELGRAELRRQKARGGEDPGTHHVRDDDGGGREDTELPDESGCRHRGCDHCGATSLQGAEHQILVANRAAGVVLLEGEIALR